MPKKAARYKFRVKNGYVEIRVVLVKGQLPRYFTGKTYEEAEAKADEAVRLAAKDVSTDRGDCVASPNVTFLKTVDLPSLRSASSLYRVQSVRDGNSTIGWRSAQEGGAAVRDDRPLVAPD